MSGRRSNGRADAVDALAHKKQLHPDFLRSLGLLALEDGAVSIPVYDETGALFFWRQRGADGTKPRFHQPGGQSLRPYGLWRLGHARAARFLWLCEGESDTWAMWALEQPALGLPGAEGAGSLTAACFEGIGDIYICPDADEAGATFAAKVARRLWSLGYTGKLWQVAMPPGIKDVSDLRCQDVAGFADALIDLVQHAQRVEAPASSANGHPAPPAVTISFPRTIPASQLRLGDPAVSWLWNGFLRRGEITLMPALWKSGKTTLMAHLLRAFATDGEFLGRPIAASKVFYVTEETEGRWAMRRDQIGLEDHVHFMVRPFAGKPRMADWEAFLREVSDRIADEKYDLVVFDTLANLWPLRDENDASAVQACLMPLHGMIGEGVALELMHHTRKSDGQEATASRGSGALTGFVDTIIEFRRYAPTDRKDRRRVLSGYGRHDDTPDELVIELSDAGYIAHGDRPTTVKRDLGHIIPGLLPHQPPGLTIDEILERWPGTHTPHRQAFLDALREGAETGKWVREGAGRRGAPYTFWTAEVPPPRNPFD